MDTNDGMPRIPVGTGERSGRRGSILEAADEQRRRGRELRRRWLLGREEEGAGEGSFVLAVHRGGVCQARRAVRRGLRVAIEIVVEDGAHAEHGDVEDGREERQMPDALGPAHLASIGRFGPRRGGRDGILGSPRKVQAIVTKKDVAEIKEHFDKRTTQVEARFGELKSHFDKRTAELRAHFDASTAETKRHADVKVAQTERLFGVVAEGLRSEIRQVAEGVTLANERIDGLAGRMDQMGRELRSEIRLVAGSQADLRTRVERLESKPTT